MIDGDKRKRSKGFRLILVAVLAAVVLCLAVPAWYLGRYLVAPTLEAGKGADCPACAVDEWFHDGPWGPLGGDDIAVANVLCASRRDELRAQLREMNAVYQAAAQRWGVTPRLTAGVVRHGDSPQEMADGHVSIVVPVRKVHELPEGGRRSAHERDWTFDIVEEGGWRICGISHPPLCDDMILCAGPPPSTPARASRGDADPLVARFPRDFGPVGDGSVRTYHEPCARHLFPGLFPASDKTASPSRCASKGGTAFPTWRPFDVNKPANSNDLGKV
jgi:hypothetical protein